jgi:hypothetical protein
MDGVRGIPVVRNDRNRVADTAAASVETIYPLTPGTHPPARPITTAKSATAVYRRWRAKKRAVQSALRPVPS